ncbi:hypothetical protein [Nostoc sp. PA-18-2419]|uniref:hypothetical protein n=1 Tax=Nostoc sp. PA-18-2419 TaxID=2575443 RepID=UPI0011096443|nr:hypothetical protein [Nostoc sp. PA-18-2419]
MAVLQYAEMVGFLKGQRLAGVQLNCKLSGTYDQIKAEYERLTSAISIEESEELEIEVTGEVALFTEIKVLERLTDDEIEIQIGDECRAIKVYWDNDTNTATSLNQEVAVVSVDGATRKVETCKLEIFDNNGADECYPLTKMSGSTEWLYPDAKTKVTRIQAWINDTWKWVEVRPNNQQTDILVSASITACREVDDNSLGITKRYPIAASFTKLANKWVLNGNASAEITWISIAQESIYPKMKIGDMVYLQGEYGSAKVAAFQIVDLHYSHLCLMASVKCIVPSPQWHRETTTVVPYVQLVDTRKVHK